MPGAVHDSRGRAESEADRSLLALHHDRLAGLIGSYCAGSVGGGCFRCRCWLCVSCCLLCRCRARLRKRQWRDQRASESDNCFLHYNALLFTNALLSTWTFTPKLRSSRTERTLPEYCASV